jgi:hypothetical protein
MCLPRGGRGAGEPLLGRDAEEVVDEEQTLAFFVPRLLDVKQRGLLDEMVLRSMRSLVGL